MSPRNQQYIHIEEDIVLDPSTPRVVKLRNIAYSRPISSSEIISRSQALDSLMPLSRNPWSNVPTLMDDSIHEKPRRLAGISLAIRSMKSNYLLICDDEVDDDDFRFHEETIVIR
ncbi:hypothetical protein BGZ49_008437 [Haplosporangium sp. Z 27]|nr:hypothetical protein BGZ49_008437 [Haplosporangium sp. Z 27]